MGIAKPRYKGSPVQAGSIPKVTAVLVKPGGSGFMVPPLMRVVGAGEEITIEYDGKRTSALAFVVRTFGQFHFIFEVVPIPPGERDIPKLLEGILW